jgi:hypothetical protein
MAVGMPDSPKSSSKIPCPMNVFASAAKVQRGSEDDTNSAHEVTTRPAQLHFAFLR